MVLTCKMEREYGKLISAKNRYRSRRLRGCIAEGIPADYLSRKSILVGNDIERFKKAIFMNNVAYGVIYILNFPEQEDPKLVSLEMFGSYEEAQKRSQEIVEEFIEDYGEDFIQYATENEPVAIMYNGDVTGYAFIQKVKDNL